jgi:hypothetical protein
MKDLLGWWEYYIFIGVVGSMIEDIFQTPTKGKLTLCKLTSSLSSTGTGLHEQQTQLLRCLQWDVFQSSLLRQCWELCSGRWVICHWVKDCKHLVSSWYCQTVFQNVCHSVQPPDVWNVLEPLFSPPLSTFSGGLVSNLLSIQTSSFTFFC